MVGAQLIGQPPAQEHVVAEARFPSPLASGTASVRCTCGASFEVVCTARSTRVDAYRALAAAFASHRQRAGLDR
jgi:hypothetical protein